MTRPRILQGIAAMLVALPLVAVVAGVTPDVSGMVASTIGVAGSPSSGGQIVSNGTLGQPQPIGMSAGPGRVLRAGFWGRRWGISTAVGDDDAIPTVTRLVGNAPNPFNPRTRIDFELAATELVRLEIFDARGALVHTLVSEVLPPGRHQRFWDGTDASGRRVASGLYFYRLAAGDHRTVRKMLMVK
jgi:hypothetical protein